MDQQEALKPDVGEWRKRIKRSADKLSGWRANATKYYEIYESGKGSGEGSENLEQFNIFFANTETLRSNVYNKAPEPRVSQRFKNNNPVTRTAADVLERAIGFEIDNGDADEVIKPIINDGLVAGFGHARVRYNPKMVQRPLMDVTGAPMLDEEGQPQTEDVIGFQSCAVEQVDYDKVVWDVQRRWDKSEWVAFEHNFTDDEVSEQFQLESGSYTLSDYQAEGSKDAEKRCAAYEVWDKKNRIVFFILAGCEEALKVTEDPLRLEGFFPCPKPIQFLKRNKNTVPLPEYEVYRKLAEKLARAVKRKNKIIEYCKAVGIYDKASKEMADLLSSNDGEMVPAEMNLLAEGGQPIVGKAFEMLPIDGFARVLAQLELNIGELKQLIYELTGISDIMRGQSVASESATAQRIKGNFGTRRVQERQKEVARFVRDIIRIMGEIIAEHYEPQVLAMMTGFDGPLEAAPVAAVPAAPDAEAAPPVTMADVVKVLRDDAVRSYSVSIEDNSTIAPDEDAEKKNVTELLTGITTFLTGIAPVVQSGAMPIDAAKELLLMAVRTFKGSRAAEEAIGKIQAPQPPVPPVGQPGGVVVPPQSNGSPMA